MGSWDPHEPLKELRIEAAASNETHFAPSSLQHFGDGRRVQHGLSIDSDYSGDVENAGRRRPGPSPSQRRVRRSSLPEGIPRLEVERDCREK